MRKIPTLLLLSFFLIKNSIAQKEYFDGYYVTIENDTVKAKITQLPSNSSEIKVMTPDGEKIKIHAKKLKGFSQLGIRYYEVLEPKNQFPCFGNKIESGYLNLYETMFGQQYLKKSNSDTVISISGLLFKKTIIPLISDDPEILALVNSEDVGFSGLPALVHNYNINKKSMNYSIQQICSLSDGAAVLNLGKGKLYNCLIKTDKGDLLSCKINFKTMDFFANGSSEKMDDENVESFTILNYYTYKAFRKKRGKKFYRQKIVSGELNLYVDSEVSGGMTTSGPPGGMPTAGGGISPGRGGGSYSYYPYYIETKNGDLPPVEIRPQGFKKDLLPFIKSYPDLSALLDSKEIDYEDLQLIIELFNKNKAAGK